MEEVMQMEVLYNLRATDGAAMEDGFWFTVNNVEAIDLAEAGFNKPIDLSINRTAGTSEGAVEERPSEEKGAQLFKAVRSEEHTSGLQSLMRISYAVFCLKKKKQSMHIIYNK